MKSPFKLDRRTKIVATLGPASNDEQVMRKLVEAGVNVFRLNFSHGSHEDQRARFNLIRSLEEEFDYPIGILMDLQGPKLRIGTFAEGKITLKKGDTFNLYLERRVGDQEGVSLPHKEIFDVLETGHELLVDDGKVRLKVTQASPLVAVTTVVVGGVISDRKGVNVPDTQ